MDGKRTEWLRGRTFYGLFPILLVAAYGSFAQEHKTDLLNQLYNEIVNSAPGGEGADSMQPKLNHEMTQEGMSPRAVDVSSDKNTERLSKEIESMVKEANERHSEAVRFMLDTK